MCPVGCGERDRPRRTDRRGGAGVDGDRRVLRKAAVIVLVIGPSDEIIAVRAGVFEGAKACRESRAIRQRFIIRLGVRIIVGDMRSAVSFGDT